VGHQQFRRNFTGDERTEEVARKLSGAKVTEPASSN